MNRRSAWIAAATAVVVLVACGLGWWLLQPGDERDPRPDAAPPVVPSTATESAPAMEPAQGPCDGGATKPFTPRQITFDDIVDGAEVIGVPRDSRGVTGVLPISEKADVAWDLDGIRPGERRGNVLLNTHTWPDGSALGNALLDRLRQGGRIVLEGSNGDRLCYEVEPPGRGGRERGLPAVLPGRRSAPGRDHRLLRHPQRRGGVEPPHHLVRSGSGLTWVSDGRTSYGAGLVRLAP